MLPPFDPGRLVIERAARLATESPDTRWHELAHAAPGEPRGLTREALARPLKDEGVDFAVRQRLTNGPIDPGQPSFRAPFVVLGDSRGEGAASRDQASSPKT